MSEKILARFGYLGHAAISYLRDDMTAEIRLGTSGFVSDGWPGLFYPDAVKPSDYLRYYATKFDTIEIGSTFYRLPKAGTVNNRARNTLGGKTNSIAMKSDTPISLQGTGIDGASSELDRSAIVPEAPLTAVGMEKDMPRRR